MSELPWILFLGTLFHVKITCTGADFTTGIHNCFTNFGSYDPIVLYWNPWYTEPCYKGSLLYVEYGPRGCKIKGPMGPNLSESTGPVFMIWKLYESPLALNVHWIGNFPYRPQGASKGPMGPKSCLRFDICQWILGWFFVLNIYI